MTHLKTSVTLPHLSLDHQHCEKREIYTHFMRHLRQVPISKMEMKVLSSIHFTADIMGCSDAHIAKELVEMGLRAPRIAFPIDFLDYADSAAMRCGWSVGAPSHAIMDLRGDWQGFHEQLALSPFRHVHSILREDVLGA